MVPALVAIRAYVEWIGAQKRAGQQLLRSIEAFEEELEIAANVSNPRRSQ
jgi:hypothetical protein